ncbi:MAG TPA: hypothetical protein VG367_06140 [Mucilaginibacter sp.]|jgi:hypothetical protein|nr:hypothetical protein [Mucilaginibacter sp.]
MYWCKRYLAAFIWPSLLLCFVSCKRDSNAAVDTGKFFDLKGYFASEAARLKKLNPNVDKTAIYNYQAENQKVHIDNWASELSMFSESDINKPAWKLSYDVQSSNGFISYKAKDPELKTQDITIKKDGDQVKWILIINHTKSTIFSKKLYETTEKLSYFPDSVYHIQKKQYTRFLGIKTYNVKGKFN